MLRLHDRSLPLLFLLLTALAAPAAASEPFLVTDLDTGGTGSFPHSFVELDGLVYFIADDTVHGRELWVSDGTTEGTRRITDIDPGEADSLGSELVVFDDRLFFPAAVDGEPAELWTSDGSEEGTTRFGPAEVIGTGVHDLTLAADQLLYVATLDGEERLFLGGAPLFCDFCFGGALAFIDPSDLTPTDATVSDSGPLLYFTARLTPGAERTLWVLDGAAIAFSLSQKATQALPQIVEPVELAALPGGRVVAAVETPNVDTWELWVSGGTPEETEVIFEVTSLGGPFIDLLTVAGGQLFFTVSDGFGGFELWRTDGTEPGTLMVAPLLTEEPQEVARLPAFTALEERLFFQGFEPATGHELWISDGTAEGTELFDDIVPGPGGSDPLGLVSAPNQVFFSASTPEHGRELWATGIPFDDDTFATFRVTDANPGPGDSNPGALRFLGDRLWLSLRDETTGPEPWVSDSSADGTRRVAALNSVETASSSPVPAGSLGRLLFFSLNGDPDAVLWRSDGGAAGTFPLTGAAGPARLLPRFQETLVHGDSLYFSGFASPEGDAPDPKLELWGTDGETAEPVTALGATSLGPIVPLGERVLFTAAVDGELGLYSFEQGTTELLTGLCPATSATSAAIVSGATRAFVLVPGPCRAGPELWVSDGAVGGTAMVTTLGTGAAFAPAHVLGDRLFFVATTPESGNELWTSDGTAAGTRLAADVLPGEPSSNPHDFAALDGWLYFVANAGESFEDSANLWRIDSDATGLQRVHRQCVDFGSLRSAAWELYFVPCARRDTLWMVEGEPPIARQVAELEPPIPVSFPLLRVEPHTSSGSLLYFLLEDAEAPGSQPGIFTSDGTEEGTRVFTAADGSLARPGWVRTAGGLVFFDSDDGIHGRELWAAPLECFATDRTLCLGDDRFSARARWRDFVGKAGGAPTVPVANESGGFWFFDESNPELFLKTLDGRMINDRFWVFFGSLSNVPFDVAVVDTLTGAERVYTNPSERFASFGDVDAFDAESTGTTVVVPPAADPPTVSTSVVAAEPCLADAVTQCQLDRFQVQVEWTDFGGQSGPGRVRGLSGDLEGFWFFDPDNVEMAVKVLDGRPINGRYWVFFGSLTDVAFELTVTDTATGAQRTYSNPPSNFSSFGDAAAFLP